MPVLVHLSIHLRIHPSNLSNIHFVHCVYFISIHFFVHLFLQSLVDLFIFFLNAHVDNSSLSSFLSSWHNQYLVLFIVFIFFLFSYVLFHLYNRWQDSANKDKPTWRRFIKLYVLNPRTELVEPTDCDDDDDLSGPQATFINTLPGSSKSKHPFFCPQSLRCLGLYLYHKIRSAWCKLKLRK